MRTALLALLLLPPAAVAAPPAATPAEARAFIEKVNQNLKALTVKQQTA